MFPFQAELQLQPDFSADYREVLRVVFSLLTPERQARVTEVVSKRCFNVVPVLENLYDRGNISAVLRSCEAFGLGAVHLIEAERFKESQRTTAGADKWVEVKRWRTTADCVAQLKAEGKRIVVTSLTPNSVPLDQVDFTIPTALVLGNEKDGASPEIQAAADQCVQIPMSGFVQSFNISVAAALCFYHLVQDRWRRQKFHADLTAEQQEILKAVYAFRTLDSAVPTLRHAREREQFEGVVR